MSLESINAKLDAVKWQLHAKSKLQIELFLLLYDFKNGSANANDFAFKSLLLNSFKRLNNPDWGCCSEVECFLNLGSVLGFVVNTVTKQKADLTMADFCGWTSR